MKFTSCDSYTVGAEWELQLLDVDSLDLSPGIESVLNAFAGDKHVTPEFFQSCVELNSPVAGCSAEIREHFRSLISTVLDVCRKHGMDLAGAGTHPFCRRLALITPLPRYQKLESEHGYIGHSQIAFATHVHIGMKSGDAAIRTMRYLIPCLPLLIAVTANSPFWRGHYTGYACYRRRLLTAAKTYGIPPYFDNWQDFVRFFDMAKHARSVRTIKDIHWDIRPHPDFGTLECRVMDAQATVDDVAFVAGLVRVVVAWIGEMPGERIEAVVPRRLSSWADRENHFRATHWGMEADLIHDESGNTRPLGSYLGSLAEAIEGIANDIGEGYVAARLLNIANETPGYRQQLLDYEKNEDTRDVVSALRSRLHAGSN
ncbi:MAG: carboxylate-amine ligase [Gammaproteobacteria bacterium]